MTQTPPKGLKTAGRALWRSIASRYVLRPDEEAVLWQASRLTDEIAGLERELEGAPAALPDYPAGSKKINPLVAELRSHRLALARLLDQLGLASRRDLPIETHPDRDALDELRAKRAERLAKAKASSSRV